MGKIEIRNLLVSECYTNCYLCKNKETGEGFIVDPGENELKISVNISKMEMKPVAIILTHGHYDHIGAVNALKERYGIKVYVSEAEKELIGNKKMNLSSYFDSPMTIEADEFLKDGQKITLAGINMTFIATPGHTKGSVCYLYENAIFSGDTLFRGTCGRCDFYGGDSWAMHDSLAKLALLEGDRPVYPGHEGETSLDQEWEQSNEFDIRWTSLQI